MFENRNRHRKKNAAVLIFALILFTAFGFGYYLNYGGNDDIGKKTTYSGDTSDYRIPDSIRNPIETGDIIPKVDAAENPEEDRSTNASTDNIITPETKVIFKTYFTLCSHMQDKDPVNMSELINFTEVALKNKFPDWKVSEFSKQQVILTREKQTYCPRHYIIGVKDGNIAIFVYDSEGTKILYEETETSISTFTPEDQKKLEYGIIADSEDELQQMLEGFSE